MSFVWRYLTKREGVTALEIAKSTGKTKDEVLAEMRALEKEGKVKRRQVKVGTPHLFWRSERYPLCALTTLTMVAVAAAVHQSPTKLRSVLKSLSTRTVAPQLARALELASTSPLPHELVARTLQSDEVSEVLAMDFGG